MFLFQILYLRFWIKQCSLAPFIFIFIPLLNFLYSAAFLNFVCLHSCFFKISFVLHSFSAVLVVGWMLCLWLCLEFRWSYPNGLECMKCWLRFINYKFNFFVTTSFIFGTCYLLISDLDLCFFFGLQFDVYFDHYWIMVRIYISP